MSVIVRIWIKLSGVVRAGVEVVVSLHSVARLYLQHADPSGSSHEAFVADEPCGSDASEVAPAVSRSKAGRSVAAV